MFPTTIISILDESRPASAAVWRTKSHAVRSFSARHRSCRSSRPRNMSFGPLRRRLVPWSATQSAGCLECLPERIECDGGRLLQLFQAGTGGSVDSLALGDDHDKTSQG